jgi:demethoxyubiquinone hydroxylase (CLK1/Coq7/Cat5 family)
MPTRLDLSTITLMDAPDLATLIEVEACERYSQFAERRLALFGNVPPKVRLDDLFDVEAPYVGAPRWNMSPREAYLVALASEEKAFAFYEQALRYVDQPDIKALFEELREEEAEHVRMIQEILANQPVTPGVACG